MLGLSPLRVDTSAACTIAIGLKMGSGPSNSFLIEEGADPILVARRNGHVSTRMVLDSYGHLSEGSRRQTAQTMDRVFDAVEIGRQKVVKTQPALSQNQTPIPKVLMKSAKKLVEMWGLEPQPLTCEVNAAPSLSCVRNARNSRFSLLRQAFRGRFFVR
jgi:hypothetical protein